ncbi:MAG: ion channel [Bryobacteraceae bacterium]
MPRTVRTLVKETWETEASLSVFLGLMVLIVFVLPALGFGRSDEILYADVSYTMGMACGVSIAWKSRALFFTAASFALAAILFKWATWFTAPHALGVWPDVLSLISTILIAFILLRRVFSVGPVTTSRIQGAIAVYLSFGIAWAHAFHITSVLNPGSFSTATHELTNVADWIYFSFITLTTVGYGDIVPVKPIARSLATSEAFTGQLYLAVLLAHLVSMRVSGSGKETNGDAN